MFTMDPITHPITHHYIVRIMIPLFIVAILIKIHAYKLKATYSLRKRRT
jgi:hypothetical protein